jgi:hypothetical protein
MIPMRRTRSWKSSVDNETGMFRVNYHYWRNRVIVEKPGMVPFEPDQALIVAESLFHFDTALLHAHDTGYLTTVTSGSREISGPQANRTINSPPPEGNG